MKVLVTGASGFIGSFIVEEGLKREFERLNVPAWVDLWGEDVNHDWPWWLIQFPYFISHILDR